VIVSRFLDKVMRDGRSPPEHFDLFAVESGAAAMSCVLDSLMDNALLHPGDTIALGTSSSTPEVELPDLARFGLTTIDIRGSATSDGRRRWQYPAEEIAKLADPRIKAFVLVNPSNPALSAMAQETHDAIVELVRTRRPDLLILTDDVYGTLVEGFRSLAADLPQNTILFYSFSKHFGCAGWRLGVIAMHEDHVVDRQLKSAPDQLKFIDRLHTAGLSTPQQVQMLMFAGFALLDENDAYAKRCREIVHAGFEKLVEELMVSEEVIRWREARKHERH
jgi:aspartate 4-decarboxylase